MRNQRPDYKRVDVRWKNGLDAGSIPASSTNSPMRSSMAYGITVVNGFLFGTGMIVAAFVMKHLFSVGFCG